MRLDPSYLSFLTRQEFRVLVAIEMGMKNHQFVPAKLINSIANLKTGNAYRIIRRLLKLKFINHVSIKYDGYKLNYSGYDYLALQTFMKRGTISQVVGKLGVGKQSDIYTCLDGEGNPVVLKFARLGRTSFRTIKLNRDYIKNRTAYNWLYLSRISSTKQYLFMQTLYKAGFPTPVPLDWNRHGIVMSFIDGATLTNLVQLDECERVFKQSLDLLVKFAENGLIHSDFNEFNLLLDYQTRKLKVIDFPQCVSTSHHNAQFYFNRDVECIYTFFDKLTQKSGITTFKVSDYPMPQLENIKVVSNLDVQVKASGHLDKVKFSQINMKQFEQYQQFLRKLKTDKQTVLIEQQVESDEEEQYLVNLNGKQDQVQFQNQNLQQMALELQNQVVNIKEENQVKNEGDENQKQDEDQESQQQVQQKFKGLSDYQIRQLRKQQKLKERAQKKKQKQEKSALEQIRQIVRKKPRQNKRHTQNKNKGNTKVDPNDMM